MLPLFTSTPARLTASSWRFPLVHEKHRLDAYPDHNDGAHIFRYPPNRDQRRCAMCGLWETNTSRAIICDKKIWNGAPE